MEIEFKDLVEASEAARVAKHAFKNPLKPRNHPQLVIGAPEIPAFQQLTGINSVFFMHL